MLGSSATRLGRAVAWFNRRALRLTRPGPRWFVASVKLGLTMKVAGVLAATVVSATASSLGYDMQELPRPNRGALEMAFLGLVLAPLLETGLVCLVYAWIKPRLGLTGFVLASTILAYAGHHTPNSIPIAAALAFCVMSYQYVSFREDVGAGRAFAGVAVSHAVCNSVPTLLVTLESVLGRSIL